MSYQIYYSGTYPNTVVKQTYVKPFCCPTEIELTEGGNNVGTTQRTPDPRLVQFVEAIKSNPCRLSNTPSDSPNVVEAVAGASYYINTQVPLLNGIREHRYFVPLGPKGEDRDFIELACGEFHIFKHLFHTYFEQTEATG